jgi:hypothetical protein
MYLRQCFINENYQIMVFLRKPIRLISTRQFILSFKMSIQKFEAKLKFKFSYYIVTDYTSQKSSYNSTTFLSHHHPLLLCSFPLHFSFPPFSVKTIIRVTTSWNTEIQPAKVCDATAALQRHNFQTVR